MDRAAVIRKLGIIQNLPTLPKVVFELEKVISNPNKGANAASAIIQDDPAMMFRILKVVNSAYYGLPNKIDNIQQAVALLGMEAVKRLALTTAVFSTFKAKDGRRDFNREDFWKHSISTSVAMQTLHEAVAPRLKPPQLTSEALHLAGLTHDIGKIIYEQHFHSDFIEAIQLAEDRNIPLCHAEAEIMGIDHAELGAWLGKKWNLPGQIVSAIRWHHAPTKANPLYHDITHICHISNYICNQEHLGFSGSPVPSFNHSFFLANCGLKLENVLQLVDTIKERSKKSEVLLALA